MNTILPWVAMALAVMLCVAPLGAEAQPPGKVYQIGLLLPGNPAGPDAARQSFLTRLSELGWTPGQNLLFVPRYAEGQPDRLTQLAVELVQLKVSLIVTAGTQATFAAKRATTTIPIVMFAGDPVGSGLVASLARPGGNVTGLTADAGPELVAKRLELEWGFACPPSEFFEKMILRLPEGLRATIGFGLEQGLVIPQGYSFLVKGLGPGKGPNWEYYVQVAEFVRLSTALAGRGYELTFEDDLMDIGVYSAGQLAVCCEIKEKSSQATRLVSRMRSYQPGVDLSEPDRGNDPLRKAKYLVTKRPKYFYLVAIGARFEFGVAYPRAGAFELREDLLPFF